MRDIRVSKRLTMLQEDTPILTIFFLTNPERKDWRASPDDLPREKNTPYGVFNFALFFSATCWR